MYKKRIIVSSKLVGRCILIILFFTTGFSAFSQKSNVDSTKVVGHSPRKATIYSAVFPGMGQMYNRKYWKVPLVYAGFATLGYFINFNNEQYTIYKQAYSDIIDTDPYTNSHQILKVNPSLLRPENITDYTEALRRQKDYWRRNRDLVVIGTVVFYAVNIIDASVDAHFFNFDISDDLTFNWVPGPVMCMDNKLMGVHFRFTF
ncbi:MAG: DUF5683 domain-containing protein [Bacteroidota bacterium]|nr:hypothetical protein [Odoribacter sp.]MDP3644027.1 DUF5683 domain-containing protein [Bacteroidota bacterium]